MITAEELESERAQKNQSNKILDQLILNMKALMLLDESHESVGELIKENITNSHDEQIQQFVKFIQRRRKGMGTIRGYFMVAAAELILASCLIIAGLAAILPSVIGFTSPQELVSFIGQITSSISLQTLSNPLVPGLELLLAVLLLLGAFHTVRLAALNLREMRALGGRYSSELVQSN